jgi:hypothetical protein
MSGVSYFRDQVQPNNLVLFKREDPTIIRWCGDAQLLAAYGEELQRWVAQLITPETTKYAQGLLEDEYWELYNRVDDEHRIDERHATHPCLHRAWRDMRKQLDNMRFRGRIKDFMPDPARFAPAPVHPVIEGEVEPFDELPAILDGVGDFR